MQKLFVNCLVCITFLVVGAIPAFAQQDQPEIEPRIVGGQNVNQAYPWMVNIYDEKDTTACGATLIDPSWVLTAAHCVTDEFGQTKTPGTLYAYVGNILFSSPANERLVSEIIVNETYNPSTLSNDIALLKLANPINKQVISIADTDTLIAGDSLRIIGWGGTQPAIDSNSPNENLDTLQEADVPFVNIAVCNSEYIRLSGSNLNPLQSKICAGYSSTSSIEKDACFGDSGGPLVVRKNNQWYQVGVTSFGLGCAQTYGVYTKISAFSSFIETNAKVKIQPKSEPTPPSSSGGSGGGGGSTSIAMIGSIFVFLTLQLLFRRRQTGLNKD